MTRALDVKYRTKTIRFSCDPGRYDIMITLVESGASWIHKENGFKGASLMYTVLSSGVPKTDYDRHRLDVSFPDPVMEFLKHLERNPRERFESLIDDASMTPDDCIAKIETEWDETY
jgi:hypothetical protein